MTTLKPVHTGWIVEFYNHVSTPRGKEIIGSGWKNAGIFDALELGSTKLPSIDPFQDIDPMLSNDVKQSDDNHLLAICDVTADELCYVEARFKKVTPHDTDSKYEDAEN